VIFIKQIGPLRVILAAVAISMIVFSFFTDDPVRQGWAIIPTLVIPAVVPIVFFVLLLDILMSGVFMVDKTGQERSRFKFIALMDTVFVVLIVTLWLPYFRSLGS